jgi:diguanylate cyclase (GGDEF)-like protein
MTPGLVENDMDEHRARFIQFRHKLVIGYVILCALLVSLLGWKFVAGYRADRAAAIGVTENSARAMAAHVEEIVDAVDQPLRSSAMRIAALAGTPLTAQAIAPLLAASSRASDARYWLLFIDAAGNGVVASNNQAVAGVSFAGRAYFADPATLRGDRLHVGGPTIDRTSRQYTFFVSRRVESASGEFLGVIAAPVDAWRVANVFERARLGPAMSIALATGSGTVIARAPLFEASFGVDVSRFVPQAHSLAPNTFVADSPFNAERRLFSFCAVGQFPLVVAVGVTQESWMADVRADLAAGLIGLFVALAVAFFSGRFALDQYERLGCVEARQRKLIGQLGAAKEELARSEKRMRVIADSIPGRVAYINADERYTFHNAGEQGAPLAALMGKTLLETHGAEIYALLKDDIRRALLGERVSVERYYTLNGALRYFRHQYTPDIVESAHVIGLYAMVTDITDFKAVQQRLAAAAHVDALTGLPNRAELLLHLDSALARCRRNGRSLACLYLDIDKFKEVNDLLGHAGGDCALIEFGRRLRACVRESDVVARLAGDEFVIALEALEHPSEAERVAAKIIAAMSTPFDIEGTHRRVTTSVGMVIADPLHDDARSLLRSADAALYRAKRAGRNRVEMHSGVDDGTPLPHG